LLINLEFCFQMIGLYLTSKDIRIESDEYRIVVIGESTSDSYWSIENRYWPNLLREKLNSHFFPKKVNVINLAKGGSSSSSQRLRLFELLNHTKIDMVISMLGINDRYALKYLHSDNFFDQLKLVKMIRWLSGYLQQTVNDLWDNYLKKSDEKKIPDIILNWKPHEDDMSLPESFEKYLKTEDTEIKNKIYNNLGTKYLYLYWFLFKTEKRWEAAAKAFKYFELALNEKPFLEESVYGLVHCGHAARKTVETRKILKRVFEAGFEPSERVLTNLASYYSNDQDDFSEFLLKANIKFDFDVTALTQLRENYLAIADKLIDEGTEFVVMGYPTTRINSYKILFSDTIFLNYRYLADLLNSTFETVNLIKKYEALHFVDNYHFRDFERVYELGVYFTDFFTTLNDSKFGHTTELGHLAIANSAYNVVMPIVAKKIVSKPEL
jgi:hypothetical protein